MFSDFRPAEYLKGFLLFHLWSLTILA